MKQYLSLTITRNDGSQFNNPLKLSEVYLISKIAKDNKKIEISLTNCSKEQYNQLFS